MEWISVMMPQEQLREHLSFVQQRAWLFSGTIAENLRYGNPDADDKELWHALEIAQAKDFVERCLTSWTLLWHRAVQTFRADKNSVSQSHVP